jgi:hypothetical protein
LDCQRLSFDQYSFQKILNSLANWRQVQAHGSRRKLIVHADHSRLYTEKMTQQSMEQNAMKKASHPISSPDLATSDFRLFDHVNQRDFCPH